MSYDILPGQPLAVDCWWGEHLVLVVGWDRDGFLLVAHNSAAGDGVAVERLGDLSGDREVRALPFSSHLTRDEIVRRALSQVGTSYSFSAWNCEDFVFWALGKSPRSPQRERVASTLKVITAGALLVLGVRAVARA